MGQQLSLEATQVTETDLLAQQDPDGSAGQPAGDPSAEQTWEQPQLVALGETARGIANGDDDMAAPSGTEGVDGSRRQQTGTHTRQSDRARLVGLAGVARAREALAEATKRAEQRHYHEAA